MNIKIELSEQEKKDILTDAIETGSISYWIEKYHSIKRDKELNIEYFHIIDNSNRDFLIDGNTIQRGIDIILSGEFEIREDIKQSILNDNNDSESCDCIIQAGLFGELIYG